MDKIVTPKGKDKTGAVIALKEFRNMRHDPQIQQVIGYWEALRGGRPAPLRAEIDPRGIEGALDRVFLAERIGNGIGRFRLAGMALNDLMGMEVRGMPLTTLILPEERERFAAALERVFQGGVRTTMRLEAARGLGRPVLTGELLLLPLANDRNDTPLVLGCLSMQGSIGRPPRRMRIDATEHTALSITAPATPRPLHQPDPVPHRLHIKGFAEPKAASYTPPPGPPKPPTPPVPPAPRRKPGRPALRLVKTDA